MTKDNILTPQYLEMDYDTMKQHLQTLLSVNPVFKDYNFEGANISLLMELVCYLGMITTYYTNQIAKNQYIETADLYETVHMLSRIRGYNPHGYISSSTNLNITINLVDRTENEGVAIGDSIYIPAWKQITCNDIEDDEGDKLKFSTIKDISFIIPSPWEYNSKFFNGNDGWYSDNASLSADEINNNLIMTSSELCKLEKIFNYNDFENNSSYILEIDYTLTGDCEITDLVVGVTSNSINNNLNNDGELHTFSYNFLYGEDEIDNNITLLFNSLSSFELTIENIKIIQIKTFHTFDVPVKQGIVHNVSYLGEDIVENIIELPLYNFDYDINIDDDEPSIDLTVNNVNKWTRVKDFYDLLSGLREVRNVYMLRYNKYQKYILEFSNSRNIPKPKDKIDATLLISAGDTGNLGANKLYHNPDGDSLITIDDGFIINNSTISTYRRGDVDIIHYSINNNDEAKGGSSPEQIVEIKDRSTSTIHSQFRNITKYDYISHLESRPDVQVANVWGEQDIAPSGSLLEYNKVFISLIPKYWGSGTIITVNTIGDLYEVINYSTSWKIQLSRFLEPRKMLSSYEEYVLPEIIFFAFDIGIKVRRTFNYSLVAKDVEDKLKYYFASHNRKFNEIISFTDITEYIKDPSIISNDNNFYNVRGIQSLVVRNIKILNNEMVIYEPNESNNYPQYLQDEYEGDNLLRYIKLGFNQFPEISINNCVFRREL